MLNGYVGVAGCKSLGVIGIEMILKPLDHEEKECK